jgi:hypothetical protein
MWKKESHCRCKSSNRVDQWRLCAILAPNFFLSNQVRDVMETFCTAQSAQFGLPPSRTHDNIIRLVSLPQDPLDTSLKNQVKIKKTVLTRVSMPFMQPSAKANDYVVLRSASRRKKN